MALSLTCLNASLSLPSIPVFNNLTSLASHPTYDPNGKALATLISSALARLTFSTADVEAFLRLITSDESPSWDASTVVGTKPLPSVIVYLSVTLALFLVLSVVFCIVTCTRCPRRKPVRMNGEHGRKCSSKNVCVVLMLMVVLTVIGVMIYVAVRVGQVKSALDEAIREINQEVYPKEISIHFEHLLEQFEALDRYSTQNDSLVINGSRSLLVKAFNEILQERYFLGEITQSVSDSQRHIGELNVLVQQETSLSNASLALFRLIEENNRQMIEYLKVPVAEVCDYAGGNETQVDASIFDALDQVHQQLRKLIERIQTDILNNITPWQNAMLLSRNVEDQVRWYIGLVGIILLVFIPVLGLIPIVFISILLVCRRCQRRSQYQSAKSKGTSRVASCSMRIVFGLMMVLMILTVLLTGVLYAVDLLVQGACRVVHDDRPFLISFFTDQLIGPNTDGLIIGQPSLQTALTDIVSDCGDQIHFSGRFFENLLTDVDRDTAQAMDRLNGKIFDKFTASIDAINITADLTVLQLFSNQVNSTAIRAKANEIITDLNTINLQFQKITDSVPVLPTNAVNQTIVAFKAYLNDVIQSTVDTCPLPLDTLYKADTLVCHALAGSISGLWFSLFIYLFFIIFGLCLCGLCGYKRF